MADIELVIKIPEDEYRWIIKSDKNSFAEVASKECMLHTIKNGLLLPKGHGDLIDSGKLIDVISGNHINGYEGIMNNDYTDGLHCALCDINDAETVVPADEDGDCR